MWPYSPDNAIKTFGKLLLQFISTIFIRFKKAVQFPKENENITDYKKCGGLMVSVLNSGLSVPGPSPGQKYCVVFLGKTL